MLRHFATRGLEESPVGRPSGIIIKLVHLHPTTWSTGLFKLLITLKEERRKSGKEVKNERKKDVRKLRGNEERREKKEKPKVVSSAALLSTACFYSKIIIVFIS